MNKVILIQSPAKFYDAVPCFYAESEKFGFFDKYYFVTDYKGEKKVGDNCQIIQLKKDRQFCTNMLSALPFVEEDIFFVTCEDCVLKPGNEIGKWNKCFEFMINTKNAGFLRMSNTKNRVKIGGDIIDNIFPMAKNYKYYISLQPGIWRRDYFKMSLTEGCDAFKYEISGSKKVKKHKKLISYSVKENVFFRTNFYAKGKYYRHQFVDYAIKNNLDIDRNRKIDLKGKIITVDQYKELKKTRT